MARILPSSATLATTIAQTQLTAQRAHRSRIRCSSSGSENGRNSNSSNSVGGSARIDETKTPKILKLAVTGVTEFLRFFSSSSSSGEEEEEEVDAVSISSVDDVVRILKIDYENAYFVTGIFTSAIYDEDCLFEDPTIAFRGFASDTVFLTDSLGTQLYARNLKLLVPFFDHPSIELQSIEKDVNSKLNSVLATWKLRTYLRLPWRPLISIVGTTVYELNEDFKIVRHTESWNVSALEAVGQIFTPAFGRRSSEL